MGGLTVTAGGATVVAGGVKAAGGMTVDDSGLTVTAGGLKVVDGGITISQDGLVVTSGGVTTSSITSAGTVAINAASGSPLTFKIATVEKARVHTNGFLGIGTATPTVELDVNGGVQGTSAYAVSSDLRWKKGIRPLQSSLQKITNITGVTYHFRRDEFPGKNFQEGAQIGFIAQHVEATIPEIVRTDPQGWKSVQYSSLLPVLVEALKEQEIRIQKQEIIQAKVDKQQSEKIQEQKAEIQHLTKQVTDQERVMQKLSKQIQALSELVAQQAAAPDFQDSGMRGAEKNAMIDP